VLALMDRGIEPGDRQQPIATDKASLIAEGLKVGKTSPTLLGARWRFSHSKTSNGACCRRIRSAPFSTSNSAPSTSILSSATLSVSLKYSSSEISGTDSVVKLPASSAV